MLSGFVIGRGSGVSVPHVLSFLERHAGSNIDAPAGDLTMRVLVNALSAHLGGGYLVSQPGNSRRSQGSA